MCADNEWMPSRNSGGIPLASTRFSLEYGDEQADARWDRRTRLAKPNSQARTRTANNSFSLFSCWPRAGLATLPSCEGHTYKHSSTYTYRCSYTHIYIYAYYTTTVNRARMYISPNKKYTGTWYINQIKQQYCTSTYICTYHGYSWPRAGLATLRGWFILLCYNLLALYINTDRQQ